MIFFSLAGLHVSIHFFVKILKIKNWKNSEDVFWEKMFPQIICFQIYQTETIFLSIFRIIGPIFF